MNDLRQRYLTMEVQQRQHFLACYAHELTILARMALTDSDWEGARQCNESLHRITGHLSLAQDDARDQSFISLTIAVAQERGWSQTLRGALDRSSR